MKKLLLILLFAFAGIMCQAQREADTLVVLDTVYVINNYSGDTMWAYTELISKYYYDKYFQERPTKRETYFNPFKDMTSETIEFILTHYNQEELKWMLSPITWRDKFKTK